MKLALIAATLALAGCAVAPQYMWVHSQHTDEARFRQDVAECEYNAVRSTGNYTPDTRGMRTAFGAALSSAIDMRERRTEVGVACMRARGYVQRPVDHTALRVNADPAVPTQPANLVPPPYVAPPAPPPAAIAPPPPPIATREPPAPPAVTAPASPAPRPQTGPQLVCEGAICTYK